MQNLKCPGRRGSVLELKVQINVLMSSGISRNLILVEDSHYFPQVVMLLYKNKSCFQHKISLYYFFQSFTNEVSSEKCDFFNKHH